MARAAARINGGGPAQAPEVAAAAPSAFNANPSTKSILESISVLAAVLVLAKVARDLW